jgi:hypothetical protein
MDDAADVPALGVGEIIVEQIGRAIGSTLPFGPSSAKGGVSQG